MIYTQRTPGSQTKAVRRSIRVANDHRTLACVYRCQSRARLVSSRARSRDAYDRAGQAEPKPFLYFATLKKLKSFHIQTAFCSYTHESHSPRRDRDFVGVSSLQQAEAYNVHGIPQEPTPRPYATLLRISDAHVINDIYIYTNTKFPSDRGLQTFVAQHQKSCLV